MYLSFIKTILFQKDIDTDMKLIQNIMIYLKKALLNTTNLELYSSKIMPKFIALIGHKNSLNIIVLRY